MIDVAILFRVATMAVGNRGRNHLDLERIGRHESITEKSKSQIAGMF